MDFKIDVRVSRETDDSVSGEVEFTFNSTREERNKIRKAINCSTGDELHHFLLKFFPDRDSFRSDELAYVNTGNRLERRINLDMILDCDSLDYEGAKSTFNVSRREFDNFINKYIPTTQKVFRHLQGILDNSVRDYHFDMTSDDGCPSILTEEVEIPEFEESKGFQLRFGKNIYDVKLKKSTRVNNLVASYRKKVDGDLEAYAGNLRDVIETYKVKAEGEILKVKEKLSNIIEMPGISREDVKNGMTVFRNGGTIVYIMPFTLRINRVSFPSKDITMGLKKPIVREGFIEFKVLKNKIYQVSTLNKTLGIMSHFHQSSKLCLGSGNHILNDFNEPKDLFIIRDKAEKILESINMNDIYNSPTGDEEMRALDKSLANHGVESDLLTTEIKGWASKKPKIKRKWKTTEET